MERKDFQLSKAKLVDGGLEVTYKKIITNGDEVYTSKIHEECTREYHPDLRNSFKACDDCFNEVFSVKDKIETRGISLSGVGDNTGVVLTGVYTTANGQKVAVNSPRIRFGSDSFGFEEELEELVHTIEDELFAYLYEGKQAQLELFE